MPRRKDKSLPCFIEERKPSAGASAHISLARMDARTWQSTWESGQFQVEPVLPPDTTRFLVKKRLDMG